MDEQAIAAALESLSDEEFFIYLDELIKAWPEVKIIDNQLLLTGVDAVGC